MPELPEVETVRRTLDQLIAGRTIREVEVRLPRIIRRPAEPELFCRLLAGQTIREIGRRGKFLRLMTDDYTLVSHLRMEGRYGLYDQGEPEETHTHVIFRFADSKELRYKDVRQFGTMDLFERDRDLEEPPLCKLGMEPLEDRFTEEALRALLASRTTKIKPALLNQEYVCGIGNIYVDEALFKAGLHPERACGSLSRTEWGRLHEAIVVTLKEAVEAGGSSIKSYVNGQGEMGMFQQQLRIYGRNGQSCLNCGQPVEKMVVGGRGTHYCRQCQPAGKRRTRPRN